MKSAFPWFLAIGVAFYWLSNLDSDQSTTSPARLAQAEGPLLAYFWASW